MGLKGRSLLAMGSIARLLKEVHASTRYRAARLRQPILDRINFLPVYLSGSEGSTRFLGGL
jgi:hypothetical protein